MFTCVNTSTPPPLTRSVRRAMRYQIGYKYFSPDRVNDQWQIHRRSVLEFNQSLRSDPDLCVPLWYHPYSKDTSPTFFSAASLVLPLASPSFLSGATSHIFYSYGPNSGQRSSFKISLFRQYSRCAMDQWYWGPGALRQCRSLLVGILWHVAGLECKQNQRASRRPMQNSQLYDRLKNRGHAIKIYDFCSENGGEVRVDTVYNMNLLSIGNSAYPDFVMIFNSKWSSSESFANYGGNFTAVHTKLDSNG